MDFIFAHGDVVFAVFALHNEPCDEMNAMLGIAWATCIIAGKADHNCEQTWDQKNASTSLSGTGVGAPKKACMIIPIEIVGMLKL
jgi:hypothetical protein